MAQYYFGRNNVKPDDRETPNSCAKERTNTPKISAEEKARRADAVRRGFANTELEAFAIPGGAKKLALRYTEGEITLEEPVSG